MVKSPYFTLVARNSHLTGEPKADGALILFPLPLHQCSILWVFKATQKEKKLKEGIVVTPGNQTRDLLHRRPCTNQLG